MEIKLNARRSALMNSYNSKKDIFICIDKTYIYPNQMSDALKIFNIFYVNRQIRAISIIKRTKVGMNGLMIEIAKVFGTHPDNEFFIQYPNIFIITGMSNKKWEENFSDELPSCLRHNVFHHGKLSKFKKIFKDKNNSLIIIDENDVGSNKKSVLDKVLKELNLLDKNIWIKNNIKFIFVSATNYIEISHLNNWEDCHEIFHMTIPNTYVSHGDFLKKKILKE